MKGKRLRILMVSEDLPGVQIGGLGKHVVTLSNALLQLGHEVVIMGRSEHAHAGSAADIGFHGKFIPGFDFSRPGWKEAQLGFFNSVKRPWFANKVAQAIMREAAGYDVVHYHGHLPMVGRYVDQSLNFVQTRHDQGSECVIHLRFRNGGVCNSSSPRDCAGCIHPAPGAIRQSLSAHAVTRYRRETATAFAMHKTIFVSDFLRRQFLRQLPEADLSRCKVIHNFIQYPLLASHAAAPDEVVAKQVLLVGRIDTGKGFREFLAAARGRLPPDATVSIIGDGPERAALEREYGSGQIRFLGWKPYLDVIALSARSHLCVVPSVWEEPCGTTVLEALALGRQCIALARGGTPELAAYQYYPGQLQLADSMEQLVGIVRAQLAMAPVTPALPATFGMDVFQAIPNIVEFYAQ